MSTILNTHNMLLNTPVCTCYPLYNQSVNHLQIPFKASGIYEQIKGYRQSENYVDSGLCQSLTVVGLVGALVRLKWYEE